MQNDAREFLVEVSISLAEGESLDDWKWVTRMIEIIDEGQELQQTEEIAAKIRQAIELWKQKEVA